MADWSAVLPEIARHGIPVSVSARPTAVGGGDISDAWRVDGSDGPVFLKTGPARTSGAFAAEADGLKALAECECIRVPNVLGSGLAGPLAWIALEWLPLEPPSDKTDAELGRQLARMHRRTFDMHGWHCDNSIGATPQVNTQSPSWAEFYARHRIGHQLSIAARYGYGGELQTLGGNLVDRMEELLAGHEPPASLLHGDLWSGNRSASVGQPVIFDPAVYAGDRETDLAMTRLFGGFPQSFYRAYEEEWPLPEGHERRLGAYQLYHVLNHLNLFGQGYLARAVALMRELLEAISPGDR